MSATIKPHVRADQPHPYQPMGGLGFCEVCIKDEDDRLHAAQAETLPAPLQEAEPVNAREMIAAIREINSLPVLKAFIEGYKLADIDDGPDERFSQEEQMTISQELDKCEERVMSKLAEETDAAPPPEKAAEAHQREAHEVDLRAEVIRHLESQGYTLHPSERQESEGYAMRTDVQCKNGIADIVTYDAIYEIACSLTPEKLSTLVALVDSYVNEIDATADAVIITCCSGDEDSIEQLDAIALVEGVRVQTFEQFIAPPEQLLVADANEEPAPSAQAGETLFPVGEAGAGVLVQQIDPAKVSTHPSLLMRAEGLDKEYVKELEAGYRAGKTYPPSDIFDDGFKLWLADGNHRHAGAAGAGVLLDIVIHKGTLRDAIIFAMRANAEHGLKPTHNDKRLKAVTLLADPEWYRESDTVLANDIAGGAITQQFLSSVRRELAKLIPALQSDDSHLDDESLAAKLDITPGLVRVVRRRLPDKELESLSQNILSDDGRRRGADGVVRTVTTKTAGAENEASLFTAEEEAAPVEAETATVPDADSSATPAAPVVEDVPGSTETKELSGETARTEAHDAEDKEEKTTQPDPPPPFDAHFGVTMKNAGWELHREGRRFHATNEKLQMATILFDTAQQAIDDAVKQQDRYEEDQKEKVRKQAEKEKRQAAENLLKDRDLTVTYTFMKELPGEVTVAVRLDDDAEGMEMDTLDISKVRPFPEAVLEMITKQVSQPARKQKASAAAPAAAKKAASKKSPAKKSEVARTKTMAKKTSGKQPAARAGAAKKTSTAKKSGAAPARSRK